MEALTWMVDQIKAGTSPRNVAIDTQYNAFKSGRNAGTFDGIWQINDLKTTATKLEWSMAAVPQIFGAEGGLVERAQLRADDPAQARRQQAAGVQGVHRLHQQEVGGVGRIPA